ncbi:MAG TPA: PilZ domain-containing protein [Sphingomicrobium sp.]|nr:PilZ domain-containing protein [Sphingomicrobium sp.]
MDQSIVTQNRRSSRSPMLLSAKIDVGNADVAVILRNLSSEGALIEGPELPPEGSVTVFRRNELCVNGRIVWVQGRFAGVAFDRQLEREELLREVPVPRQRFERQYRRPGLACRPLSEADRKMVQMWMTPEALRTK